MWKLPISLACSVFLTLSCIAGAAARAEAIAELSASRVVDLAPPAPGERTPVVSSVALDPTGRLLAAVGDDHLVRIFDVQTGALVHCWRSHTDWVKASAFRPDGRLLVTAGADRRIRVWETPADKMGTGTSPDANSPGLAEVGSEPVPILSQGQPHDLAESPQAIYTLVYGPDGRSLAAAGFGDKVSMFDAEAGRLLREFVAPGSDIRALVFSPDGARLAAAGRAGAVRIWDAQSGRQMADVQVSARRICALAYSPDGKLLAAAGQQRIVRLLDASTAMPVADLPQRAGEVLALCFCGPDTLASAGSGNVIHLWDVAARGERCRLVGHTGSVTTLVFDSRAGVLISGGYDTTIRLWDLENHNRQNVTQSQQQEKVTQRVGPSRTD